MSQAQTVDGSAMRPGGIWAAPGRVNIIGEHTDYNGGYCLPMALPQVVRCTAMPRTDGLARVGSQQHPGERIEVPIQELAQAAVTGWSRYPLGVVHEYHRRGHHIPGVDLELDGSVPIGAGLSSSAALECAVAIALRDLFELPVPDTELIDIANRAENDYVGAPTGTLDQTASIRCVAGHALFLDAGTGHTEQVPFDLAAAGLALLIVDTNTPHALVDGEYARRRRECEAAAAELGVERLRDVTDVRAVAALADPVLRRRARHVVSENARVLTVVQALREGSDPRVIGPVLTAAHTSLRDDFMVSTAQLDTAVDSALDAGAHGARMVGGGFGGSIIALVDARGTDRVVAEIRNRFRAARFAEPRTFVAVPSAGARRVDHQ
ncbi:galactokinase [Nocardia sp. NPDC127579]|uniref:galactokinase n=1 Tax=Nocardia sp. NPDC127579 TaxID=3345402 RepID=UPI00363333A1